MLLPLLASLTLSAPVDSTLPTPAIPVADSATPVGATPVAGAPTVPAGPLVAGEWAFGFRALGASYDLVVRRALGERLTAGLVVGWIGDRIETFGTNDNRQELPDWYGGTATTTTSSWAEAVTTYSGVRIAVPFECYAYGKDQVHVVFAAGPRFTFDLEDLESNVGGTAEPRWSYQQKRSFGGGLEVSAGLRWYFRPNLALTADAGAEASWIKVWEHNENGTSYTSGTAFEHEDESESDRVSTGSYLLGFGLETWF